MAEEQECKMIFVSYRIDKVNFEVTNSGISAVGMYPLSSIFKKRIKKIDDNEFEYTLICNIQDTDSKKLPYRFSCDMVGKFKLKNWKSDENTNEREVTPATVLFPLLRAYAHTISANANLEPPILLGMIYTDWWREIETVD